MSKSVLLSYIIFAGIFFNDCGEPTSQIYRYRRIIEGNSPRPGSYGYAATIQIRSKELPYLLLGVPKLFCGASLVSPRWLVTSAHCFYSKEKDGKLSKLIDPKLWHVRLASPILSPTIFERIKNLFNRLLNLYYGYNRLQSFYHVDKIVIYPDYMHGAYEEDIALLKLKEPIIINRIKNLEIIPLPVRKHGEMWPNIGQICTLIGWGCYCAKCEPENEVKALDVPVLNVSACSSMYKIQMNLTRPHEFCAGFYNKNKGVCSGDSGGPLVCEQDGEMRLAGIVSATHVTRPESYPGIFTRVSLFTDWIQKVIN